MNQDIDKKLAELELEKRRQKRAESEEVKETAKEEKKKLTLEEVVEQMKQGKVDFNGDVVIIRNNLFFEKRLAIPLPFNYLQPKLLDEEHAVLVNDEDGVSLNLQLMKETDKLVDYKELKENVRNQMAAAKMKPIWLEDGNVEDPVAPLYFGTYRVPTAAGFVYNLFFCVQNRKDKNLVIGNYNCMDEDADKWGLIIKAAITFLDFK